MIQQDNLRAAQVHDQQQAIRDRQRQILRDENLQLMNQKRNQDSLNRSLEIAATHTSPVQIGDGYRQQLANMQERDRAHSLQTMHYNSSMLGNSPARQKQLQAEMNYSMSNQ